MKPVLYFIFKWVMAGVLAAGAAGCGKKGDPFPKYPLAGMAAEQLINPEKDDLFLAGRFSRTLK